MSPTASNDRVCKNLTVCLAGEGADTPATSTSDRSCKPCPPGYFKPDSGPTNCLPFQSCISGVQFASRGGNATHDILCSTLTVCQPGEEERIRPTATTDRVCIPCDTGFSGNGSGCVPHHSCSGAQYETQQPTATTDRLCADLTVCQAGEEEVQPPDASTDRMCAPCKPAHFSAASDRLCQPHTVCSLADFQVAAGTASSDRVCAPAAVCNAGEETLVEPTATTDRLCGPCKPGLFSAVAGSANCTLHHVCEDDQFVVFAGNSTADRLCANITHCNAGFETGVEPTSTSDRTCQPCSATAFRPLALSRCVGHTLCSELQFEIKAPTPTSDRVCKNLTVCSAGQETFATPTVTTDRACADCVKGTFTAVAGTAECSPYSACLHSQYERIPVTNVSDRTCSNITVCRPGLRQDVAPTATSDRQCIACPPGNYTAAHGSLICQPHKTCGTAEYQVAPGTASSDRVCAPVTACNAGEEVLGKPSATTDRLCAPCKSGMFSTVANSANCTLHHVCEGNQFVVFAGNATADRLCSNITQCNAGFETAAEPSSTSDRVCRPCRHQSFNPTEGAGSCRAVTNCTTDEFEVRPPSFVQDRVCRRLTVCQAGNATDVAPTRTTDRECRSCDSDNGEYQPAAGQDVCLKTTTCLDHQFQVQPPSSVTDRKCHNLTVCAAGEETDVPASSTRDRSCMRCAPGFFSFAGQEHCGRHTRCNSTQYVPSSPGLSCVVAHARRQRGLAKRRVFSV